MEVICLLDQTGDTCQSNYYLWDYEVVDEYSGVENINRESLIPAHLERDLSLVL